MAAQMWPDVEAKMLQLRLEDADGTLLQVTGLKQLRLKVQGGSMIFPHGGTCFFFEVSDWLKTLLVFYLDLYVCNCCFFCCVAFVILPKQPQRGV